MSVSTQSRLSFAMDFVGNPDLIGKLATLHVELYRRGSLRHFGKMEVYGVEGYLSQCAGYDTYAFRLKNKIWISVTEKCLNIWYVRPYYANIEVTSEAINVEIQMNFEYGIVKYTEYGLITFLDKLRAILQSMKALPTKRAIRLNIK